MLRAFLIGVLWLGGMVGVSPAHAFDTKVPERLRYRVYWGPLQAGRADLEYKPEGKDGYTLGVKVKDSSMFLDMDSRWVTTGQHRKGELFVPLTYEAKQAENDYRADKLVRFDAAKKQITYTNRLDAGDVSAPLKMDSVMRDAMSEIYLWRSAGREALAKAAQVEVMGVKRPFTLTKAVAKKARVTVKGKTVEVWSVEMGSLVDGKPHRDTWTVMMRDDANLTPVQVVARNKFGTFMAVLEE